MSGVVPSSNDRLRTLDERLIVNVFDFSALVLNHAEQSGLPLEAAAAEVRRVARTPLGNVWVAPKITVDTSDWPMP